MIQPVGKPPEVSSIGFDGGRGGSVLMLCVGARLMVAWQSYGDGRL